MIERCVAVHEAGHAVVAAALGVGFTKRGITAAPSKAPTKEGVGGYTHPRRLRKQTIVTQIAFLLSGGIAEGRVNRGLLGTEGDVYTMTKQLALEATRNHATADHATEVALAKTYGRALRRRLVDETPNDTFSVDVEFTALALYRSENTLDALNELKKINLSRAISLATTSHFQIMAEGADVAREILNRHWSVVLALGTHLMQVGKMSGDQLEEFLKDHGV